MRQRDVFSDQASIESWALFTLHRRKLYEYRNANGVKISVKMRSPEHYFSSLECLYKPERWSELQSFAVIESVREYRGKANREFRFYISSLLANAEKIAEVVWAHRSVENKLHRCMDMAFADDQMRARTGYAAHNLAVLKRLTMNLIRQDSVKRQGGIKA
ncbi:TPA: ISAs1 family transposase [Escherichia coli]|nr:ISAs1 family transposase [Escherichia coli]